MARLIYVSHPEVVIDPSVPVPRWRLNAVGRARAEELATSGWLPEGARIISSTERKAMDLAEILAGPGASQPPTDPGLDEIDRSATGFLPADRFEAARLAFFGAPDQACNGWERAVDAQARTVAAALRARRDADMRDLVICGHGAVGTLLYCHLAGLPIDARHDQPPGGGCIFTAPLDGGAPDHPWRRIEDVI